MPQSQGDDLSAAILETVRLPLLTLDADLRVGTANDAFFHQFDVSREETISRLIYDLGNGQWNIPELRQLLGEILPEKRVVTDYRVEHEFERIGRRIMHVNARRIDKADAPDLILLAISDDTESETLRVELNGRIELADKLIDSVREGLLILDPELRVQSANDSFYEIFGVERDQTVGHLVYELGNGQWDIAELRRLLEDVLPRESSFDDYEVTHRFEDVGRRVMVLNGRRLDHMDLILLAIRDITDAREAEVRLEEVATVAHIGVFEEDRRSGRLFWSPEMRSIVGWPQDEPPAAPGTVPGFIHPDDRPALEDLYERVTDPQNGGAIFHQHRIVRPDGETRWVEMFGRVEFSEIGGELQPVLLRGALLDVTERKLAQDALREREERRAFLLELSDAIRPLPDADDIVAAACRLLAERLDVGRAYYVDIDEAAGIAKVERDHVRGTSASLVGVHDIQDFEWSVKILRRGDCHATFDSQTCDLIPDADRAACAALDITACMSAPLIKNGRLVGALCVTSSSPREWTEAEIQLLTEVGERVWSAIERARAEDSQREGETRYRQLFNSIDQGFCVIEMIFDESGKAADYRFEDVNDAFERQTGLLDAVGKTMRSFVPDHEEIWFERYGRVAVTREPERFESKAEKLGRFYEVSAFPFGEPGEGRVGVLFNDISERKEAEAHRELLLREVNHHAKNMLSVVLAVAGSSASDDASDFLETFRQRVMALSANEDLLVSGGWRGVDLHDLVRTQLAHFGDFFDSRIDIDGPDLVINGKAAEALGMAVHELATNASKYGALSDTGGRVAISWEVVGDPAHGERFKMRWREEGGPAVTAPSRRGFGSSVIEDMVKGSLSAEVRLDYASFGVSWEVDAPAKPCLEIREEKGREAEPRRREGSKRPASSNRRGRILVVEDEMMIALALSASLKAAGHDVVGPVGSVDAALTLIEERGCDAAVLDVNLGQETSAPIAETLDRNDIPFVAVTGYNREQLPEALNKAPLLSKPIDTAHLLDALSASLSAEKATERG